MCRVRGGAHSTSSVSAGLQGLSIDKRKSKSREACVAESKFLGAKVKDNVQYIVIGNPGDQSTTQDQIQRHLEKLQEKDANNRSRSGSLSRSSGAAEGIRTELINSSLGPQKNVMSNVSTFAADKVIGKGSFGVVYKARNLDTKEVVAIKKVYQDRRFKNRELQIMRRIKHPNIVELKNYYFSTSSNKDVYLNMILEYVPDSLFQALVRVASVTLRPTLRRFHRPHQRHAPPPLLQPVLSSRAPHEAPTDHHQVKHLTRATTHLAHAQHRRRAPPRGLSRTKHLVEPW